MLKKSFVTGLISDGDLRREMRYDAKKITLEKIMTKNPLTVNENMPASKALTIMNEKKITSLLVVSDKHFNSKKKVKLKGIIHIHFLLRHGLR